MFKTIVYIGAGSCIGGIARYLLGKFVSGIIPGVFPWGTFAVNLLGCLAIGLIYGLLDRGFTLSPEMKAFLTVGLCGGFTTFSTFSNDGLLMLKQGFYFPFLLYTLLSVAIGIAAVFAGGVFGRFFS